MLIYICQNIISTSVIVQVINVILHNGKVFFWHENDFTFIGEARFIIKRFIS